MHREQYVRFEGPNWPDWAGLLMYAYTHATVLNETSVILGRELKHGACAFYTHSGENIADAKINRNLPFNKKMRKKTKPIKRPSVWVKVRYEWNKAKKKNAIFTICVTS